MAEATSRRGPLGARRREVLPYDMFDETARTLGSRAAEKLASIYHRGQERAWSGREVLPALVAEHGPPRLADREREALTRIFAIILWGELAAWKVSAQMADELVPLEARMAATSQAFDEARHFYTMRDYLTLLGPLPERLDPRSEWVLAYTLEAPTLAQKVCGMQLLIEPIALTIFQAVREREVEPVLSSLLRYYEVDEARHVGLGVQYLPTLLRTMGRIEQTRFLWFQFRMLAGVLTSLKALVPDFAALGMNPRDVVELGKAKQYEVFGATLRELGLDVDAERSIVSRVLDASDEWNFPRTADASVVERFARAWERLVADDHGVDPALARAARVQLAEAPALPGMGTAPERRARPRPRRTRPAA